MQHVAHWVAARSLAALSIPPCVHNPRFGDRREHAQIEAGVRLSRCSTSVQCMLQFNPHVYCHYYYVSQRKTHKGLY